MPQRGFTLIELILVIVMFSILAIVSSTRIGDISRNIKLSGAINRITSDINQAKAMASAHRKPFSISFDSNNEKYYIYENGTLCITFPESDNGVVDFSNKLFTGVDISSININNNSIEIDKWGNVLHSGYITLNQNHKISIKKLTGHWTVSH